jgi:hypothetical protein
MPIIVNRLNSGRGRIIRSVPKGKLSVPKTVFQKPGFYDRFKNWIDRIFRRA